MRAGGDERSAERAARQATKAAISMPAVVTSQSVASAISSGSRDLLAGLHRAHRRDADG